MPARKISAANAPSKMASDQHRRREPIHAQDRRQDEVDQVELHQHRRIADDFHIDPRYRMARPG